MKRCYLCRVVHSDTDFARRRAGKPIGLCRTCRAKEKRVYRESSRGYRGPLQGPGQSERSPEHEARIARYAGMVADELPLESPDTEPVDSPRPAKQADLIERGRARIHATLLRDNLGVGCGRTCATL